MQSPKLMVQIIQSLAKIEHKKKKKRKYLSDYTKQKKVCHIIMETIIGFRKEKEKKYLALNCEIKKQQNYE